MKSAADLLASVFCENIYVRTTVLSRYYMQVTAIYAVITMPGNYPGFRALLWYFNGHYDSPDMAIYIYYIP
jgi:hypothetical protein